jgi:hypothetical protein
VIRQWLATRMAERDRRTLKIGAVIIATLALLAKGVPAWSAWQQDAKADATEMAADAALSDAAIAVYSAQRDSLHGRAARLRSLDSAIVSGADPASAAASLTTIVSDAASDAGVKLGAVQPRVDSEPHSLGTKRMASHQVFTHVSAHGDVLGDVVALTQFIADLEHGPVLLAVRDLSITQPEPAAPTSRMETLHADFTVVGLSRNGATATPGGNSDKNTSTADSLSRSRSHPPS